MRRNYEVEVNFFTDEDCGTPYEQITYQISGYFDEDCEAEEKALKLAKESSSFYHDSWVEVNEINRIFNNVYEMLVDIYEENEDGSEDITDTKTFLIEADGYDEAENIVEKILDSHNIDFSYYNVKEFKIVSRNTNI